jgi:formate dehydrogenase assembly factor FdhD
MTTGLQSWLDERPVAGQKPRRLCDRLTTTCRLETLEHCVHNLNDRDEDAKPTPQHCSDVVAQLTDSTDLVEQTKELMLTHGGTWTEAYG